MQPTVNTPFERFAFAAAAASVILLPFIFVACFLVSLAVGGITEWLWSVVLFIVYPAFYIFFALKIERDHIEALDRAESELSDIVISDIKTLPENWSVEKTFFIVENVVLANDYLKTLLWAFRRLFGGESISFSKLVARTRREATVRVLRKAKTQGANAVWNIRYETCIVQTGKMPTGVEVLAYATAFTVAE